MPFEVITAFCALLATLVWVGFSIVISKPYDRYHDAQMLVFWTFAVACLATLLIALVWVANVPHPGAIDWPDININVD